MNISTLPTGLRCPKCFSRLFTTSLVQSIGRGTIWECLGCGYDGEESELKDRTPPGCIAVSHHIQLHEEQP